MAPVELVAIGQPGICAQEIGQGGSLEPFAVQRHSLPGANSRYATSTNRIWSQRVPLRLGSSRSAQNRSRPSCRHSSTATSRRPIAAAAAAALATISTRRSSRPEQPVAAILGKQRSVRGCAVPASITSIERRHASSWVELISPRYKTWRCTTRPPATRRFSTTLQLRCSLPSFRRIFERRNMMAAQYPHKRGPGNRLGRHYSHFRPPGIC